MVLGVFGTVLLLILPVPALLIDMLLAVSIALALLMLLVVLYVESPSDFSGFPSLLLFITLFRLALNIATTRLILRDGYAGHIIDAFGNFVVGGKYIVGIVVFAMLAMINFIVITKGAGRIAEVAARFTLDSLPGKQMAIDAELNAGVLNEAEARAKRRKVEQEADFYGSMDGASKFVRGDAIVAILMMLVNIIGGFAMGMSDKHLSVTESLKQYTLLSIGDGLVSQVPALITSMAAAMLVTRAASKNNLGDELGNQLTTYPRAFQMVSAMLGLLGLVPGLPFTPFMLLAAASGAVGYHLRKASTLQKSTVRASARSGGGASTTQSAPEGDAASSSSKAPEKLESLLAVDTLQIELGYGLVSLADARKGGDLLERVTGVRKTFAGDIGVIVPPIRLRDNLNLGANDYRFLLKGNSIAQGTLMPGYWLAMNATNSRTVLKGVPTVEPVFQLPATWITDPERKHAEMHGYTVVDAASVLVTHLSEVVKRNCHEILTRQDVQNLLDNLKVTNPTVVNELIPSQLTVGQIQRILQNLLAEGLSIRNLAGVLEKIGDYAPTCKNPDELSEHARKALGAQLAKPFQNEGGAIRGITMDPKLEQQLATGLRQTANEITMMLDPRLARHVVDQLGRHLQGLLAAGQPPLVICAPQLRLAFRRFFDSTFADLAVLSYADIPARADVQSTAILTPLD